MGGDLNVILGKLDKKGGRQSSSKSAEIVNTFLEEYDWVDCWRHFNKEKFVFTWKGRKPVVMSRLDYFLVPINTLMVIGDVQILPAEISDHYPVMITLSTELTLRGPGYWKLNTRHLQNSYFMEEINVVLDREIEASKKLMPYEQVGTCSRTRKKAAMQWSHECITACKVKLNEMNEKLKRLYKKLAMINVQSKSAIKWIQQTNDKIDEIKRVIDKENLADAQGTILRAKSRWVSQSKHNTKYFFALEKRNAKNKTMTSVIKDGKVVKNQGSILNAQVDFYKKLYTADPNFECCLTGEPENKVPTELREELENEITLAEIEEALKSMARSKSPGLTGLTVEFYIVFWQKLKTIFMEVVKQIYSEGLFHQTACKGVITLLPKKDRELLYLKNWRPIVLLNLDYKLVSKVIARRIQQTLKHIVNNALTGFIKGRLISENLRKILDLMDYTNQTDLAGIFVSIDFEKAFDKVEYKGLYKIMDWFGFGPKIIAWVRTLFVNFKMYTYNNGYLSPSFSVQKVSSKEIVLHPYLFILIVEVLAIKM